MPAVITAELSGQRKEICIAISFLLIVSAADTPTTADTEVVFVSFFMKTLFIFPALQHPGAKINHIATIYIGPTKPDDGIRYLYA